MKRRLLSLNALVWDRCSRKEREKDNGWRKRIDLGLLIERECTED
jgi:hypothetical protein